MYIKLNILLFFIDICIRIIRIIEIIKIILTKIIIKKYYNFSYYFKMIK